MISENGPVEVQYIPDKGSVYLYTHEMRLRIDRSCAVPGTPRLTKLFAGFMECDLFFGGRINCIGRNTAALANDLTRKS